MRRQHLLLAVVLLQFGQSLALASEVVTLTDDNFDDNLSSGEPWLVTFSAPWCTYCRHLVPIWEDLATQLKGKGAHLGKVDCVEQPGLKDAFQIDAFPTIKLFFKGNIVDFNGRRTKASFLQFLVRHGALSEEVQQQLLPSGAAAGGGTTTLPPILRRIPPSSSSDRGGGGAPATPAPVPVPASAGADNNGKYTLRSLPHRGSAEPVRLLLEELAVPYEDVRLSRGEWSAFAERARRESGGLVMLSKRHPVALSVGKDTVLSHPLVILRWLGRSKGLYGGRDGAAEAATDIDSVLEEWEELRSEYRALVSPAASASAAGADFPSRKAAFVASVLPAWLEHFEARLRRNLLRHATASFFAGPTLTIADVYAFDTLSLLLGLEGPQALAAHPLLSAFFYSMATRPNIATYLQSSRRPAFPEAEDSLFGNARNPPNPANTPFAPAS